MKKIAQNASSQRNESLNSTIGSNNPKFRFYGGSESADQRVACAVVQKNLGMQHLVKILETANVTPGCIMNNQVKKMDYERSQDKSRKQNTIFKKRRRQLAKIRSSKNVVLESKKGTVYQSGSALSLDPFQKLRIAKLKSKLLRFATGHCKNFKNSMKIWNIILSYRNKLWWKES